MIEQILTWIGLVLAFIPGGIGIKIGEDIYAKLIKKRLIKKLTSLKENSPKH